MSPSYDPDRYGRSTRGETRSRSGRMQQDDYDFDSNENDRWGSSRSRRESSSRYDDEDDDRAGGRESRRGSRSGSSSGSWGSSGYEPDYGSQTRGSSYGGSYGGGYGERETREPWRSESRGGESWRDRDDRGSRGERWYTGQSGYGGGQYGGGQYGGGQYGGGQYGGGQYGQYGGGQQGQYGSGQQGQYGGGQFGPSGYGGSQYGGSSSSGPYGSSYGSQYNPYSGEYGGSSRERGFESSQSGGGGGSSGAQTHHWPSTEHRYGTPTWVHQSGGLWSGNTPGQESAGWGAGAGQYGVTSGFGSSSGWSSTSTRHHVGKGPKNYQRSDARIEEEVCDRLTADPMVDASDLECKVKDGEVTLTGSVRTREEKRRAEDLAESITGVKDVNNQVRVKKSSDRDDETIAGARSSSPTSSTASTSSASGTPGTSASSSSGRGNR